MTLPLPTSIAFHRSPDHSSPPQSLRLRVLSKVDSREQIEPLAREGAGSVVGQFRFWSRRGYYIPMSDPKAADVWQAKGPNV